MWIEINVTSNYYLLGEGTGKELALAWATIIHEYSELIQSDKANTIFEQWKKIEYLSIKIKIVHTALTVLKDMYIPEVVDVLVLHGFDFVEHKPDVKEYLAQLDMIEREAMSLIVIQNQAIAEYKAMAPGTTDAVVTRTEMDYYKELVTLGKFAGRKISVEETLFEVAAIINAFIEEAKINKKNGKATV